MAKMIVELEWDDSLSKDFITLDYISKCMFRKEHISPFQAEQVLIKDVTNEVLGLRYDNEPYSKRSAQECPCDEKFIDDGPRNTKRWVR